MKLRNHMMSVKEKDIIASDWKKAEIADTINLGTKKRNQHSSKRQPLIGGREVFACSRKYRPDWMIHDHGAFDLLNDPEKFVI